MNQLYFPRIIREFEVAKDDQLMIYLEDEYD